MPPVNLALGRYKLNHVNDPKGDDLPFSCDQNPVRTAAPASAEAAGADYIIPILSPVRDQELLGSCAPHAGESALGILLALEGKYVPLSCLHWYWNACRLDGTPIGYDIGTYLRSIVTQAHKVGVCAEKYWPYINPTEKIKIPPDLTARVRASENRISGYYKINSEGQQRLDEIVTALRANHPVIFGTQVGGAFMGTDGKAPIAPDASDMQGGHATCLVGFQTIAGRLSFRDKNSWSTGWGEHGYCWLDQDYMTWEYTNDIWVMTRMDPLM